MVIRRVGPLSCARVVGTLYAALGLIIGGILSVVSVVGGMVADEPQGAAFSAIFGVGAIILLPVLYGGLGFVAALVGAWLYNTISGFVGGIEIDAQ